MNRTTINWNNTNTILDETADYYLDKLGYSNRPSFINAAKPEIANELYEYFKELVKKELGEVESGIFGADMKVSLLNDGPVTIDLESIIK